jgi:GxxExxY protein
MNADEEIYVGATPPTDLVRGQERDRLNALTERIIGCAYTVGNSLGSGFLERVYENALVHELRKSGLSVVAQQPLTVWYDGVVVGEYIADIVVAGSVLLELKAVRTLDDMHVAQCLNYLRATNLPICLLINFGESRVRIKRLVNGY